MKLLTTYEYTLEGKFVCSAANVEAQERIIKKLKEMDSFDDMIISEDQAHIYFSISFDDDETRDFFYDDLEYSEDDTILYFADEEFDITGAGFYGCEACDHKITRTIDDKQWSLIKDWFK